MLALFLIGCIAFAVALFAIRALIGWMLPRGATACFDRVVATATSIYFKLLAVGFSAGLAYLIYSVATTSPPGP